MGIIPNGNNEPDILGFEMKKNSNKITLGDFSASEYIFSNQKKYIKINVDFKITKEIFIQTFGEPNQEKNGRFSWSGKVIPKYGNWNNFGQKMIFNKNNDLLLLYNYEKDKRERKTNFLNCFKKEIICIAFWSKEKLKNNIENKFNNKGFFICNKKNNKYNSISFGNPFNFHYFVEQLKDNTIFFDSGMYEGNSRNYSHFRANKNFWNKLITETI